MKKIGKLMFPIFFVFLAIQASGQKKEIGISIGGLNYTGEIAPEFNFALYRPAGQIFYRHNFSPAASLRAAVLAGNLYGSDRLSTDPVPIARAHSFDTYVTEISVLAEHNFLDYRKLNDRGRFAPYMTGGVAIFNYQRTASSGNALTTSSTFNPAIPLGFGIKYKLTRSLNLNGEFVARKTFTNTLDSMSDTSGPSGNNKQLANPFTNDWYYFTGISISYTFYSVLCPKY
jgi:hypothetical protein